MRRHRLPLDELTATRLAAGELAPADAPPGYAATAVLLAQARTELHEGEVDPGLLAAMVDAVTAPSPADPRTRSMPAKLRSAKVITAAAALVLTTAGAAAAATGNLPDPAQDAIADVADVVGVDLPTSTEDHPDRTDHPTGNTDNPTENDEHGVQVSTVARDRSLTGREHGQAVSEVARDGHGPDAAGEEEGDEEAGDTEGTEDTAPGRPEDPGSQGQGHADQRAELGAGNADDNPGAEHRP